MIEAWIAAAVGFILTLVIGKFLIQKLRRLMRIRNEYPAFDGEVQVADLPDDTLEITRESNGCRAVLHADLKTKRFTIRCADSAFDYES